ncbi:DUF5522 domain-containing protein [Acidicapsa dinghuensis]|uniref:DUF5522 domain-containing protein n=1 Tax=Acidicapsa dinghuensis TaxID=2218256 RepID=A0ABW1EH62_9BACT|nr:DUF5522 domain-containing protein [Acidicapsa dinghuensis]
MDSKTSQNLPEADCNTSDLQPEDYYMDGPYMVFTAAYHLRRGWCCESGCLHCPYGFGKGATQSSALK